MDDLDRLRRELRAMSLVNRQLQAQLDSDGAAKRPASRPTAKKPPAPEEPAAIATRAPNTTPVLRAGKGDAWLTDLGEVPMVGTPYLAVAEDGALYLVEDDCRRRIRSGLLAAAIEELLGDRRPLGSSSPTVEGPPLELVEGSSGPVYVIIGKRRHPVRGLPMSYPVADKNLERFEESDEIDVAHAHVPRKRVADGLRA
jgi:hypothetical protein